MAVLRASLIVSTLALLFSASTEAHVSMNPKFGEPGQVVDTAFRVPHGCNGSSTTAVLVHVPETITTIVPKDVANWQLATTYRDASNKSVSTISWSGGILKATDALEFPVTITVPQSDLSTQPNVTLYFPVSQTCEVGFTNWSAIPQAGHEGHADHGAESPAPAFVIVKNATQAAEDALKIKSNSTASPSPSANAPGAAKSNSGASGIYAGMLPIAAAAIGALAIGL